MLRKVFFRLTAVILGLTCTVLVLEVVLQAAAAVLKRADQNDVREAAADEIRIACVGESTTYGKWPAQLEDLLNQGRSRRTVRVINRGVVGILTNGIADRIDGWLDEDRPHLVITMLGINDEGNVLEIEESMKMEYLPPAVQEDRALQNRPTDRPPLALPL